MSINPKWYGDGNHPPPPPPHTHTRGFSSTVPKHLAPESWNFLTFNITLWVIVCSSFYWYIIYYVTMATLLLNRGPINLVKNDIKPLYFYLYGKIDMKYEISVSKLSPPPNFSLIPLKIEKLVKVGLWPQKQRMTYLQRTSDDAINLLRFWIEFMTHFHTTKFCFNWPWNNGDKEGDGIHPPSPYLVDFSDPISFRANGW